MTNESRQTTGASRADHEADGRTDHDVEGRGPDTRAALAFETSGDIGGVALGRGPRVLAVRTFAAPRNHAVAFLPTMARLCEDHGVRPPGRGPISTPAERGHPQGVGQADLAAIFVSIGPGSFTGLRIGVTATRMLAMATRLPAGMAGTAGAAVVAVPTMEVIAANARTLASPGRGLRPDARAPQPEEVAVLLDAQRKRLYAARFAWRDGSYAPTRLPAGTASQVAEVEPGALIRQLRPGTVLLGEGVRLLSAADISGASLFIPNATGDLKPAEDFLSEWDKRTEDSDLRHSTCHVPQAEVVYELGYARWQRGEVLDARALVPLYVRPPEAEEKWALKQHATG